MSDPVYLSREELSKAIREQTAKAPRSSAWPLRGQSFSTADWNKYEFERDRKMREAAEREEREQIRAQLAQAGNRWKLIVVLMTLELREKIKADGSHVLLDMDGKEVENPFVTKP